MKTRPLKTEDVGKVRSIHERCSDFPFPNIDHPLYVVKEVVEEDDQIVGAGLIRLTSEAVVILDLDRSRAVRAKAVEELIRTGVWKCQKLGIDEINSFLTGEITYSFADVLKRKYGFVDCEGIPLTLKL